MYRPCRATVSVQTIAHNRGGKAGWGMPGMPPARYVGRRFPILRAWDSRHPALAHKRGSQSDARKVRRLSLSPLPPMTRSVELHTTPLTPAPAYVQTGVPCHWACHWVRTWHPPLLTRPPFAPCACVPLRPLPAVHKPGVRRDSGLTCPTLTVPL